MKQFRNFTAEQKHINEIGPVGATIAGVMGLIGGYKAVKAGLKKFKGYRENRADKKARREQGFDMKVKVLNPETGKEEEQEFYIDPETGNKDLEKLTGGKFPQKRRSKLNPLKKVIVAPTDDDLDKMEKAANRVAKRKNSEVKRKIATGKVTDDDLTTDQQAALASKEKEPEPEKPETTPSDSGKDTPKDEPKGSGMATASDFVGKEVKDIPDDLKDAVQNLERKKLKSTKDVEAHMKRWGVDRVVGFSKKMGPSGMPSDYEYVKNSRVISFGDYLKEDVVSDLKKISKSKKDMEIKLSDGSEIPLDPMTADIFVKYIEGLKSSEQKRVINQIQRTERGFMKVLGKAHGE